jgi:phenylalanyl-tRNA synthetase beta chain
VKLVLSWLREFVEAPGDAAGIAEALASRGFEFASIETAPEPVIDFEITANRPDCLSVMGLAREAATAFGVPFTDRLEGPAAVPVQAADLDVTVEDADLCPRYAVQLFSVKIGPSPDWLAKRLQAAGIRPINTVVDATNYVLLERGHPTHAFDVERLGGKALRIRRARAGETIRTLDGTERKLEPDMLVIADASRPQAIGGVMGGADSEVTGKTTLVALESAWFLPASVRRTSKRLGLKTEASARFERGADIHGPLPAIRRVADLLARMQAGEPAGAVIDRYPAPKAPMRLALRRPQIARLLGMDVPSADVERILAGLGFGLTGVRSSKGEEGWLVTVPSWRVDVGREVDLIEEVGRHYGFDRLPATFPPLEAVSPPHDPRIERDALVRETLAGAGFAEAVTFTFIEESAAAPFASNGPSTALGAGPSTALGAGPSAALGAGGSNGLVPIANPLSESFAVLRPSLVPGLVDAVAHNRRRERRDVRLFEIGSAFSATDGELRRVAFAWTGAGAPEHWSGSGRDADFFDASGAVERIAEAFGTGVEVSPAAVSWLVPGRSAAVAVRTGGPEPGLTLGVVGQLQPSIAAARGVTGGEAMYVAEIDLDRLAAAASGRDDLRVASLPRYPSIVRDLSVIVSETLPAAAVRGTIRAAAPPELERIDEFDRYRGKGIADGQVSLSFHLTFRAADRTLTDQEADRAMDAIVSALERAHNAVRR